MQAAGEKRNEICRLSAGRGNALDVRNEELLLSNKKYGKYTLFKKQISFENFRAQFVLKVEIWIF